MSKIGFDDVRCISTAPIAVENPEIEKRVAPIVYYSKTMRAFKLPLEDRCEDFGQEATYNGTITDFPNFFVLDDHHTFKTGCPLAVCGNTADMLSQTRYKDHFTVTPRQSHKGLFACSPTLCTPTVVSSGGKCC